MLMRCNILMFLPLPLQINQSLPLNIKHHGKHQGQRVNNKGTEKRVIRKRRKRVVNIHR